MNQLLREELLSLAAEDARVRSELAADGSLYQGYHPRMREVHERNAARLAEIISQHGWPESRLVGDDGAKAAWLIVQHAIGLPPFQRRCLALLEKAAAAGEVPPWQPAYLLDRIRVFEGKAQVYGTQFEYDQNNLPRPSLIEDPDGVNERRRSLGLDSIEERTLSMREQARRDPAPVQDSVEFDRKYQEWLREVGWRK